MKVTSFLIICLLTTADVVAQKYKPGHYYTQTGEKRVGLINYIQKYASIYFKENKEAKKQFITWEEMSSIVIEEDSLVYVKGPFKTKNYEWDGVFARPRLVARQGMLYEITEQAMIGNPEYPAFASVPTYLVQREGKVDVLTRKNFIKVMSDFLQDDVDLKKKIESKELTLDDAETIIANYSAENKD